MDFITSGLFWQFFQKHTSLTVTGGVLKIQIASKSFKIMENIKRLSCVAKYRLQLLCNNFDCFLFLEMDHHHRGTPIFVYWYQQTHEKQVRHPNINITR